MRKVTLVAIVSVAFAGGGAETLAKGDAAFRARRYAEATRLYEEAFAAAENNVVRVEAAAQAARGWLIREEKEKGRPWLARAKKLATPDETRGWARYLGVRGRFEWKDGDLKRATATFQEMYRFCLEHELHAAAVDAAHMVAITGSKEQQVEWARRGITAAEKGGFDGWLGPLWNNLGVTYDELGKYEESLQAYLKARHYHWKVGREVNKLAADWAVGMAYRKAGQPEKALQWLRPVLAWAERWHAESPSPDRAEWVGFACRELAEAELAAHGDERAGEALKLLARARKHLEEAGMPKWDPKAWQALEERIAALKKKG